MSKMIVFVHLFNDRSGSPKVLSQVASVVSGSGVRTEMITSEAGGGFLRGIADEERVVFYRRTELIWQTLFFYGLSQLHLFFICLRYWRSDVVFYVNTMMPVGASLAAKLMGKVIICHVHETSIKPRLFKRFLRFVVGFCADKVVFVSDYLRRTETFSLPDERVVYNSLSSFPEVACSVGDGFNVLMVCSLKEYKGVFEFLEVASLLQDKSLIEFVLVLNAADDEIGPFFDGKDMSENVRIFSRQDDLSTFYRGANLVLNLSKPSGWIETFGLTLIEAFSYGVPVIAPVVGGPVEVVRDGVDGYLIDSSETKLIASRIYTLSKDRAAWAVLSCNATRRSKDFHFSNFEKSILDVVASEVGVRGL